MGRGWATTNDNYGHQEMIIETEQQYEVGVYPKRPIAIVRGKGARVWDANGREYIDCVCGQGSINLGHNHPALVAALQHQASQLMSCPEIFPNDQRAAYLAELAAEMPFAARIFLCNSGAEAIEGSLKFARLITGRTRIIAAKRGFHGRTMGALSATWEPKYRDSFKPLVPDIDHVAYNDIAALAAAIDDKTAAVLLEPVQGEGGVHPANDDYLVQVREMCNTHNALLLLDEVQTGFGRTGRMFAMEHSGVVPDIVALAKSIAGGLPMGAVVLHTTHGTIGGGKHGTTFGGSPLMCAVARAVLRVLHEEALPQRAAEKGKWLVQFLRDMPSPRVREVRGKGLLIGVELKERVQPYLTALLERGVLALPAGPSVLRLLPPLTITDNDLTTVAHHVADVLA